MLAVYLALLPKSNAFPQQTPRDAAYTFVPSVERDEEDDLVDEHAPVQTSSASQHVPPYASSQAATTKQSLTTQQKMALARPLFFPFMIPLFVVYFAEVSVSSFLISKGIQGGAQVTDTHQCPAVHCQYWSRADSPLSHSKPCEASSFGKHHQALERLCVALQNHANNVVG